MTRCTSCHPPCPGPQVLNMKPQEILGLLEEAAGTKMYEDKKKKALHTLERKQLKVDEINKVTRGAGRAQGLPKGRGKSRSTLQHSPALSPSSGAHGPPTGGAG